jgi:hypothetical protein
MRTLLEMPRKVILRVGEKVWCFESQTTCYSLYAWCCLLPMNGEHWARRIESRRDCVWPSPSKLVAERLFSTNLRILQFTMLHAAVWRKFIYRCSVCKGFSGSEGLMVAPQTPLLDSNRTVLSTLEARIAVERLEVTCVLTLPKLLYISFLVLILRLLS